MNGASCAGEVESHDVTHREGVPHMRYKSMFAAGLAVGFIAGARAGRERYDQIVGLGRKVASHPTVQKTTQAATAKATDLTKTATAKAPGLAKTASAQFSAQMPKIGAAATAARQQAASRIPFVGKGSGDSDTAPGEAMDAAEVQVPLQADGSPSATASYNGVPTELSRSSRATGQPGNRATGQPGNRATGA
jgi:hypothetical protein